MPHTHTHTCLANIRRMPHTHARAHARTHARTHAHTHAHTRTHMHTHTHTRARARTHARTHAQDNSNTAHEHEYATPFTPNAKEKFKVTPSLLSRTPMTKRLGAQEWAQVKVQCLATAFNVQHNVLYTQEMKFFIFPLELQTKSGRQLIILQRAECCTLDNGHITCICMNHTCLKFSWRAICSIMKPYTSPARTAVSKSGSSKRIWQRLMLSPGSCSYALQTTNKKSFKN